MAVQVLRRAVHDQVGAERERLLQARARKRVVDRKDGAPCRWARSATAAMSVSRRTGFVGVSMNTSFVAGVMARSVGRQVRRVDVAEREAVSRQHFVEQPERAAVRVVGDDDVVAGRRAAP